MRILLTAALFCGLLYTLTHCTQRESAGAIEAYTLYVAFTGTCARAMIFLIAHVVFFGPITLVAIFLWKDICRIAGGYGMGMSLALLMLLGLSIDPESRHLLTFLPILVAFSIQALRKLSWKTWHCWLFAGISLIFSKVWFPINRVPFGSDPLNFPLQNLCMNNGPWISPAMYLVQGLAVIITALFLYIILIYKPACAPAHQR